MQKQDLNELRQRLREAAKLATQGEWTTDYEKDGCLIDRDGERIALTNDREFASFDFNIEQCRRNAAHIATASPQNILMILDALDAAEERGFGRAVEILRSKEYTGSYTEVKIFNDAANWLEEQIKKSP